jgi:hypothetical protein
VAPAASTATAIVAAEPSPPAPLSAAPPLAEPARAEAAEPPEPGPDLPADPYLAPAATRRFPRRALVAKKGPLRFSLTSEPASHAPRLDPLFTTVEAVVVEERPRSVRAVLADENLRLVAYVLRGMLLRVATTAAWLSPAAERAPDPAAGVRVAPGIPLTETDRRGPLLRVAGEVDRIRFEGWTGEETVGDVFVPERFPTPAADGLLSTGTTITSPQGDVLARLPAPETPGGLPTFCCEATLLPGAPAGMQAVHLRRVSLEVRGLVPASAAMKVPVGARRGWSAGGTGGSAGSISDTEHVLLRAGAGVYDRAGARVGTALRATEMWVGYGARQGKEPLVGARFLFSFFGFLDARVRPGDLRPYR